VNVYPYFKQVALDSGHADNVDVNTETLKLLFLNGYTYDSTDKYVSDVLAGATEVGRTGALDSVTVTNGTLDAANETTSGIASGQTITDVVLYCDTGASDAAKVVIAHIDEDGSAAPLSLATDGSPITASFDAAGILDL
jgi:hypothetical protein